MKREKRERLVITFPTTSAAMAMEMACGEGQGRLIPIPQEISAGCGLAWCAEPGQREALLGILAEMGIPCETVTTLYLY